MVMLHALSNRPPLSISSHPQSSTLPTKTKRTAHQLWKNWLLLHAQVTSWRDEMVDDTKGTWKFLSDSGGELSFDHCSEEDKLALRGVMAVNDLAESSFAGLTAQVQFFGWISMTNAAAISDMKRNGVLSREEGNEGLFHNLHPELQLTAIMTAVQFAPDTRQSNNAALERAREAKCQKEELSVVGTLTVKAQELDQLAKETEEEFDLNARHEWKDREQKGFGSVLEEMLELGKKTIDASFIGKRIEYLSEFDIDEEGTIKDVRWCAGVVKAISDGTAPKWLKQNAVRACYKENEAALIDWWASWRLENQS